MSDNEKHPRKLKRLALRVTEMEHKYLQILADCLGLHGNVSEANRWLIHQSLLLAAASHPELKKLSRKFKRDLQMGLSKKS